MGAPHGHALHFHGHAPLHRLPAHVKIVALVGHVLAVVATPRGIYWPYAAHLLALACAVIVSRVPFGHLARRMVIEVPFVVFAPGAAPRRDRRTRGDRTDRGPPSPAWRLLPRSWRRARSASSRLLLAATTEARDIVAGFEKLRMPQPLVQIMSFMLRYTEVVAADLARMRIARESRGFRARSVRQWPALGATLGTLFIRSYERGERVHLAMLSRGYTGRMPTLRPLTATGAQWALTGTLPLGCALVSLTALVTT